MCHTHIRHGNIHWQGTNAGQQMSVLHARDMEAVCDPQQCLSRKKIKGKRSAQVRHLNLRTLLEHHEGRCNTCQGAPLGGRAAARWTELIRKHGRG